MSHKVVNLFKGDQGSLREWDPQQIELFASKSNGMHSWVLIFPEEFNHNSFMSLVVRNRFDLILDLRTIAVFEKPKFDHKILMTTLYKSHVTYVDVAHLAHANDKDFVIFFSEFEEKIISEHGNEDAPFYTLCLSDKSAASVNIVSLFRAAMRRFGSRIVELHPRALLS